MKKLFISLLILVSVTCPPEPHSKERIEKMRQRRKEHEKLIAECILKSDKASADLKKRVEENKDDHLMRALHPRDHKYDDNDRKIIRECRRSIMDQVREEFKKERELERERKKNKKHVNSDNL